MKKANWFITGCAGFIGSNLCEMLLENGHTVIGFDNLSTGKKSNIDRVMGIAQGRYKFVEGDICNRKFLSELISNDIDVVVHLAAQVSVQNSFVDIAFNNKQNIDGFLNIYTLAGERNISKFIYASSCAVYGETDVLPITESLCPSPVSPYASSKLMNDLLSKNLTHLYPQTRVIGLRFFNIFGPWQDPFGAYAAVIPKWIDACMRGEQPVIYGDGSASRDFCYVGDVCDVIKDIGVRTIDVDFGVYNIASGVTSTLNDLFSVIVNTLEDKGLSLGFKSANHKQWKEGDIMHSLGSNKLARKNLGFIPKIELDKGIELILKEQYHL